MVPAALGKSPKCHGAGVVNKPPPIRRRIDRETMSWPPTRPCRTMPPSCGDRVRISGSSRHICPGITLVLVNVRVSTHACPCACICAYAFSV
eukprot:9026732-Alexandrium_andersonii.AAC.1